jgi:sec-independent protein translocase protein TatA
MFGLGGMEIAAALIIALIVFGPKRLPEIGKTLGKGMREFKSTLGEIEDVKKSTIGQVDELKDTFKVDLSGSGGSKSAQKKDPPKAS